jgi:thiol-disulfide isomerase/thioredoxin
MKAFSLLFINILIICISCKSTRPVASMKQGETQNQTLLSTTDFVPEDDFSSQATWLLGYFNPVQLTHEPYSKWYTKGYDDYQFNTDAINELLQIKKDELSIKVVMGTWCPDSRREVPRFMRVLDIWQFPAANVTFIGVDDAKLSPVGEYEQLNIQRVPTFIIFKNNIEAGRIIENPSTSLEQDMVNILERNE